MKVIQSDAQLVARAYDVLKEMESVEGFAYTEDSYTARIPGKLLKAWYEAFSAVLFRLRSEIDV